MILTIGAPISTADLGYLLYKNPARVHSFELPFGKAHVFYPAPEQDRSRASLMLDIDPVALVRGRAQSGEGGSLDQYVNDRPYVSSSFLSVAMSRVFGTAMSGKSTGRQELAYAELDWSAVIAVAPCRGGEPMVRRLFEPLGYSIDVDHHPLDEQFPEWGESLYYTIRLHGRKRLQDLLTHIYVLTPVLDAEKHYWVGKGEVDKLLRRGEGWLSRHPDRETIASRYLRFDKRLTRDALARLADEDAPDPEAVDRVRADQEMAIEAPLKLWERRIDTVSSAVRACEALTVIDLGCGEGKLLAALLKDRSLQRVVGMDVSWRSLETAGRRLYLDDMPAAQRKRIELIHGSLLYRDKRLEGFDCAVVMEVVEHLDAPRLAAFERVVFEHARPKSVVLTTPNAEYNVKFPTLAAGKFRHEDHRFEWDRREFAEWARSIASRFEYEARFAPVGEEDAVVGPPTQMAVFTR